ncbi:hypothetical protein CGLO_00013 [Colletotrichum gloeosporioides Cg-14]|uniref:Uncharacterized protein n=1 Tax=Colletotrichum gloeosporioides (strain Cg-14) TaxID=1237896 RepID=T0MEP1_COLGC|nr:hypothetical protein CGLO_00013 [Colletotrichum gloeosporioides Cg-14]
MRAVNSKILSSR